MLDITWEAPDKGRNGGYVHHDELVYDLYMTRPVEALIGEGITDTFFSLRNPSDYFENTQEFTEFAVYAHNSNGRGKAGYSNGRFYGVAYSNDWYEGFSNAKWDGIVWKDIDTDLAADWMVYPLTDDFDGNGGALMFNTNGIFYGIISTPLVSLKGLEKPTLTFGYKGCTDQYLFDVFVTEDGVKLDKVYTTDEFSEGWNEAKIDLSAYAGKEIEVYFKGYYLWKADTRINAMPITETSYTIQTSVGMYRVTAVYTDCSSNFSDTWFYEGAANVNVEIDPAPGQVSVIDDIMLTFPDAYTVGIDKDVADEKGVLGHLYRDDKMIAELKSGNFYYTNWEAPNVAHVRLSQAYMEIGDYYIEMPNGMFWYYGEDGMSEVRIPSFMIMYTVDGSGVGEISIEGLDSEYYNLEGFKVSDEYKGVRIRVNGIKTTKELLK